jgi:hypothetical protein
VESPPNTLQIKGVFGFIVVVKKIIVGCEL